MKIEEIEVIIGTDGRVQLKTSGFSGETCLEATKDLEALLGNQLVRRETSSGIYEKDPVKTAEQIQIRR